MLHSTGQSHRIVGQSGDQPAMDKAARVAVLRIGQQAEDDRLVAACAEAKAAKMAPRAEGLCQPADVTNLLPR